MDRPPRLGHARQQREGGLELKDRRLLPRRAAGRSPSTVRAISSSSWGGPGQGFDWPSSNHGIFVDHTGNVWIGGNGPGDSHIVKFTQDGKFVAQYGKPNARHDRQERAGTTRRSRRAATIRTTSAASRRSSSIRRPTKPTSPTATSTAASRCSTPATGKMKRFWGAYGKPPDDKVALGPYDPAAPAVPALPQPGALRRSRRTTDSSTSATASTIASRCSKQTARSSTRCSSRRTPSGRARSWDVAFSRDPQQRFLYVADGRTTGSTSSSARRCSYLTSFGDGGRQPGQFFGVHSIAVDSQGNIYTTETCEGKRIQKFLYQGPRPRDAGIPGHGLADDAVILSGGWRLGAGDWRGPASSPRL